MGDVSDINKNRPHVVGEVICVNCLERWVAAFVESVPLVDLECTNCGPGYVILTGQLLPEDEEK